MTNFYAFLRGGEFASTSQINPKVYREHFEAILKEGTGSIAFQRGKGLAVSDHQPGHHRPWCQLEVAQELRDMVAARFPEAEIYIAPIGPVIGAHAGPGVMTVFFWGNNH